MSSSPPSVLIVSNGHGEDAVGALLARRLTESGVSVSAYPLVGTGDVYAGTPVLAPRRTFPSGGFGLRGAWKALVADLRAGLVPHWQAQRATLAGQRGGHRFAVAIGDAYCLWMTARASDQCIFVATAKSDYNEPHRWLERQLMRRAAAIWTRDEPTARTLVRYGLPARYEGNPLMDTIPIPQGPLPLHSGAPVVLLLPGSRADALLNLSALLEVCLRVSASENAVFVCALAPSLQVADVARSAFAKGWRVDGENLRQGPTTVLLTKDFGAALEAATIAVGLAGTANEQTAGLGKPVVAFPGPGVQYTRRFMALQRRLLGDALVVTESGAEAAVAVLRLLKDPGERKRRGQTGRQRMGSGGAVERIAQEILKETKIC